MRDSITVGCPSDSRSCNMINLFVGLVVFALGRDKKKEGAKGIYIKSHMNVIFKVFVGKSPEN